MITSLYLFFETGENVISSVQQAPPGQGGFILVRLLNRATGAVIDGPFDGVESPSEPGLYTYDFGVRPDGSYRAQWWFDNPDTPLIIEPPTVDTSASEDIFVGVAIPALAYGDMYTSAVEIQAVPGHEATDPVLADHRALLATLITDGLLPCRTVDPSTGTKVPESSVEAWQWTLLRQFATLLATTVLADDTAGSILIADWTTISGPDFRITRGNRSAGTGGSSLRSTIPAYLLAILDSTGICPTVTTAADGALPLYSFPAPPGFDF